MGTATARSTYDVRPREGAMRKTDGAGRLNQRFCRMWEFYLASSELAFRYGGLMVFQAQLARRLDSVPLTRDYMYAREREGGPRSVCGVQPILAAIDMIAVQRDRCSAS